MRHCSLSKITEEQKDRTKKQQQQHQNRLIKPLNKRIIYIFYFYKIRKFLDYLIKFIIDLKEDSDLTTEMIFFNQERKKKKKELNLKPNS